VAVQYDSETPSDKKYTPMYKTKYDKLLDCDYADKYELHSDSWGLVSGYDKRDGRIWINESSLISPEPHYEDVCRMES
jgi:hypothetical protein